MKDVGQFEGHLVYFTAVLVYLMAISYILWSFWYVFWSIWYVSWSFWYVFWPFGILFPVLVCCTKKNLATLSGGLKSFEAKGTDWKGKQER
jgi:hypothetical protein